MEQSTESSRLTRSSKMSAQEKNDLVEQINKIVDPWYKFNLQPTESPHGNISKIENFDILYWKARQSSTTKNNDLELISQIKQLGFDRVEVTKFAYIGKYILVYLPEYYQRYTQDYYKYFEFKNSNHLQISKINEYLDGEIPEDFIAWKLYNELKSNP